MTESHLGGKVYFILQGTVYLVEDTAGVQGGKLEAETEAETMDECRALACASACFLIQCKLACLGVALCIADWALLH